MGAASPLVLVLVGLAICSSQDPGTRTSRHQRPGRRVVTRVVYEEDNHHHSPRGEGRRTVARHHKRRRPGRPLAIVPAENIHPVAGFQGSYVAVAGSPGRGAVHVVEHVPALAGNSVTVVNGVRSVSRGRGHRVVAVPHLPPPLPQPVVHAVVAPAVHAVVNTRHPIAAINHDHPLLARPVAANPSAPLPSHRIVTGDRLPLPKCSYLNTDFVGDDLLLEDEDERDRGRGINAGSARACKARCRLEDACNFWTYKEGASRDLLTRDCFLKEGTPGLPVPREAVPRLGFVSGTQDNNCVCIKSEDEEDEVCPIKDPRGLVYPWKSNNEEENDREAGLPPLGWNRGVYGALDPRLGPIVGDNLASIGGNNVLEAQVRALRDQLDVLTRRLGRDRARLELEEDLSQEESPDFRDI